jgi:FdhD protein
MTETDFINIRQITRVSVDSATDREDMIAIEEPLEIQLSYISEGKRTRKSISVTMRTPGNDEELGAGFLFTEGIIQNPEQVESVRISVLESNKVLINLTDFSIQKLPLADRNFYTTSSCGVCGKSSMDAIKTISVFPNDAHPVTVDFRIFLKLTKTLQKQQNVFRSTGGLHASALFDLGGSFIDLREDVGRHNALDKVIGSVFLKGQLPLNNVILLLSGRASFELIQKAAMAGIRIVAAIGAPSSLAVEMAEESEITLIGFLKDEKFNIYSGKERITGL